MESEVKSSAIVFSGYLYQNLVGLELLCDWLEDPGRYSWVRFEADTDELAKGLDDIVAALAVSGSVILLQVKFTVDPFNEEYQLTWQWLLQKKPKGRSLLQKWADALSEYDPASVSEAALKTNRIPDGVFASCLAEDGVHVDITKIPAETRVILDAQLGTAERAVAFFERFEFRHSHKRYNSLRRTLHDRYVPTHTTHHGWLELQHRAIDWALFRNSPPPHGRITLDVLRGTLDSQRPEPLTQSFRVPPSYRPPDEDFHRGFLQRVSSPDHSITVLWGSPGQGKSTYLSFVCAKLESEGTPFIRHHYFLHLTDTSDRFSFPSVANSLMAQIEVHHNAHVSGRSTSPENLQAWIAACGKGYAAEGKRFVVLIDGLDHVWRESDHDKRMLDSLFRYLLPVPENVSLILGTQKVSAEQLPAHLVRFATDDDWIELPRMSLLAVRSWLELQHRAKRFEMVERQRPPQEDPMAALAQAFRDISLGHPLHLTYSFETLARERRVLEPDDVRRLTACPDGDIRTYYRTLWNSVSMQGKEALHLVAGSGFIWPDFGLEDCLNIRPGSLTREIGHLFYPTEAGSVPFHGSVVAFVREQREHEQFMAQLAPRLVAWLQNKSPAYHRWGWLWLFQARTGDVTNLLTSPDRGWIIDSVANGYPQSQITEILAAAERHAFKATVFARAVRFRWLKTRLHNGAEFQLGNFNRLRACALELTTDDYVLKSLSAQLDSASSGEICLLGKQYVELDRRDDAVECQEEIRKRINDRIAARAYDDRSLRAMCKEHLTLAAVTGDYSAERLVKSIRGLGSLGPSLFRHFLRELSRKNDVALLAALLPYPLPLGMRRDLERALIRLAGVCEAKLHEWPEFKRLKKHPIVACWALLYWRSNAVSIEYAGSVKGLDTEARDSAGNGALERHLHCLFFEALSKCLALGGARPQMTTPELKKRKWLNEAIAELIDAAASVGAILVRGDDVSFSHCYSLMSRLSVPNDFDSRTDYFAVKAALLEISTDVFCLTVLRTGLRQIGTRDWEMVTRSPHFTFEHWRDRYVANALHLLSASDVGELVASRERQEDNSISQFNERAELYVGLCELALTESLTDHAGRLLRKAVGCVMGYGWRKDMTVFHVLSAIEAVATRRPRVALAWLRSVCPAISEIDRITDGDETRHAKVEMAELLLSMAPSSYVAYHDFLLKSSEWYEAERTFAVLLEKEPLHTEIMHIPTDVLWGTYEVGAIRERAQAGDKYASAIIERNECRFGFREGELGKGRDRSGSSDASEAEEPQFNVEGYAPETLGRLLEDLRQEHVYVGETAVVRRWFNFWVSAGRGRDVLKAIEPFLDSESIPSGASELLDEAFEVSRRLQGKTVAYKWIVAAHVHRHGWSDFWSRESAIARLRVVAQHYPKNWKQFVLDTSTSPFRHVDEKLVIPHHRLVQLLVEIEELDAAVEVTNEMVSGFLLEVSEQPLTKPKWLLE